MNNKEDKQIPLFEKRDICSICKKLILYNYFGFPENYFHYACYEERQKEKEREKQGDK